MREEFLQGRRNDGLAVCCVRNLRASLNDYRPERAIGTIHLCALRSMAALPVLLTVQNHCECVGTRPEADI
jgi:hypothetical protein